MTEEMRYRQRLCEYALKRGLYEMLMNLVAKEY